MNCINCGAEIKSEYNNCPYCGKALQMVPDYSIYDEDDINVILESTKDIESKNNKAYIKEQQERAEKEKQITTATVKKKNTKIIVIITIILCILLVGIGIGAKVFIDHKNTNSYDYQMKQADEAMFKEKYDEAKGFYLQALALSPEDTRARLKLADLYIAVGEQTEAIKLLHEVLNFDSENYDAYYKLFQIYEANDDIDAILALKSGVTNQKILNLFKNYIVEAPKSNLLGSSYSEVIKLVLTADKGLQIYYTMNGKNPIIYGELYTEAIEISDAGMHTLKMVAVNSLGVYSDVVTETFVLEYLAPADPEVTPNGGKFDVPTYVYITVPDGCSAFYTWDRTVPTETSSEYVSPLLIPDGYNILSVIIIDDETGLASGIYRGAFEYITE